MFENETFAEFNLCCEDETFKQLLLDNYIELSFLRVKASSLINNWNIEKNKFKQNFFQKMANTPKLFPIITNLTDINHLKLQLILAKFIKNLINFETNNSFFINLYFLFQLILFYHFILLHEYDLSYKFRFLFYFSQYFIFYLLACSLIIK